MWPPALDGGGPGHDPWLLHGSLRQGYPVLDTAGHNIVPGQNFNVATDGTVSRIDPITGTAKAEVSGTASPGGPRTGQFRVPGEGALLVELARRGVVRHSASDENVDATQRIRRIDDDSPHPRVKSPGYQPISTVMPKRGKQ